MHVSVCVDRHTHGYRHTDTHRDRDTHTQTHKLTDTQTWTCTDRHMPPTVVHTHTHTHTLSTGTLLPHPPLSRTHGEQTVSRK